MYQQTIALPGSKQHFEVLDGLRGIAAITILVFHFMEMIYADYAINPLGHGFLAVDFFYCLSGFVIGYAYDDRIGQIGLVAFLRNRLIRLHPLVLMGSVLGLVGYVCNPFVNGWTLAGGAKVITAFISSIFLVPYPVLPHRAGALFPFNSPAWSLLMEYLANIVYALLLFRMKRLWLVPVAVAAAVWLCVVGHQQGWLIGGWDAPTWVDGVARISYSFLAGLLVFRFGLRIKNRLNFAWLGLLLLGAFFFPHIKQDGLTEAAIVLFYFPLLLAVGAGASVSGWMKQLCVFIGRLSYPLYMTHIFVVWNFGDYYAKYKPSGLRLYVVVSVLIVALLVLAYLVMRFYDEPVRRFLIKKWLVKKPVKKEVPVA